MIQFKENGWTDGRKDGETLFYKTLPATAGGPIISKQTHTFIGTSPEDTVKNKHCMISKVFFLKLTTK